MDTTLKAPSAARHIARALALWAVSAGPHFPVTTHATAGGAGQAIDMLLFLNHLFEATTSRADAAAVAQGAANALQWFDIACDSLLRLGTSSAITTTTEALRSVAQLCSTLNPAGPGTRSEESSTCLRTTPGI